MRGWGSEKIVAALYENADPNARAILGAFADTAPVASRLRVAIDESRVAKEADPAPALLAAWELVDRARSTNQRVADLVNQIDLERGQVADDVAAAVRLYFRDDALRYAAGRDVVAARMEKALTRALDTQNAVGDLFGEGMTVRASLTASKLAGADPGDISFNFKGMTGSVDAAQMPPREFRNALRQLANGQPFDTIEEAIARAQDRQFELIKALSRASEPTLPANHKRFYHGGHRPSSEIKDLDDLWVTPEREYAANFRRGAGEQNDLWYVDIPIEEAKKIHGAFDEINGYWRNSNLPKEWARRAQPLNSSSVKNPGIKEDAAKVAQKIARKDYNSPREVTDFVRAGVVVNTPAEADDVVRALAQQFRVIDEGWSTNAAGYFDRKLAVVFDDGMMAEVQMWPPAIYAAKKEGQKLYAARRRGETPQTPTPEEKAYWAEVAGGLEEAWSPLIGGKPNASTSSLYPASASSSENVRRASQETSAGLTARQPFSGLSTKASMPDMTASLASQSKNLTPASIGSSTPKIGADSGENKPLLPGDPQLRADAERALAAVGGDFEIMIVNPDGSEAKISARSLLTEAEDDARGAAELLDCLGGAMKEAAQ
jgi:hypothetical protein